MKIILISVLLLFEIFQLMAKHIKSKKHLKIFKLQNRRFSNITQKQTNKMVKIDNNTCTGNKTFGFSNLKLNFIINPVLDIIPSNQEEEINIYKNCTYKQGILYMIKQSPDYSISLDLIKIYLDIDIDKIRFYRNYPADQKSLFHVVDFSELESIGYRFNGTYCFSLNTNRIKLNNDNDKENNKDINLEYINLCATNKDDMRKWVLSILSLSTCKNKSLIDNNEKIVIDFSKINSLNKFDNIVDDRSYKYNPKEIIVKDEFFERNINEINDEIKNSQISEQKVERILKDKILKEIKKNKDIEIQKQYIYDLGLKREVEEEQKVRRIKEIEFKIKSSSIFNNTLKKVVEIRNKTINKLNNTYEKKLEKVKNKNIRDTMNLIKCFNEDNKLNEWSPCVSLDVFKFQNNNFTQELCLEYYGEENNIRCSSEKHFCTMCCDHHIGRRYVSYKYRCHSECNRIIKGNYEIEKLKKYTILKRTQEKINDDNQHLKSVNLNKENKNILSKLKLFYR